MMEILFEKIVAFCWKVRWFAGIWQKASLNKIGSKILVDWDQLQQYSIIGFNTTTNLGSNTTSDFRRDCRLTDNMSDDKMQEKYDPISLSRLIMKEKQKKKSKLTRSHFYR